MANCSRGEVMSAQPNGISAQSFSSAVGSADDLTRITSVLVMGLRRSGKTSMLQVVFKNCPAKDTFFLDPTTKIQKLRVEAGIPLEFWDCPGNIPLSSLPLHQFSTLLFVIDIQDNFNYSISRLTETVVAVCQVNPEINVEVFVHKADVLADDYTIETFRNVQHRVEDELDDPSIDINMLRLQFHLTSIYDHSIYSSFSLAVQRLIESLPYLEDLLNVFCENSRLTKAFLFDISSRIYVATNASPVDGATHNICCDYVHMLTRFSPLFQDRAQQPSDEPRTWANSSVRLNPDTTLAYWQITSALAIVVLLPSETHDSRRGLIEYNLVFFRQGVQEILEVEAAERHRHPDASARAC